jgi:hypothetical protein
MTAFRFLRILVTIALLAAVIPWTLQAQNSGADEALTSFAGTWRGICRDGNPFVILSIKVSGRDLVGDISIANMQGGNGQCANVIDPPSPQHAMKINGAKVESNIFSFQGSPKARFEMSLVGAQTATLKFLGTPAEDTPWQLVKSADSSQ